MRSRGFENPRPGLNRLQKLETKGTASAVPSDIGLTRPLGPEVRFFLKCRDFTGSGKTHALCQGPTFKSGQQTIENTSGFAGCAKLLFFKGYGLQPVLKWFERSPALAPEGTRFIPAPTCFAACLAPEGSFLF